MYSLIKLELKRNKLKPYYTALIIISIVMTCFLYFIAVVARVEREEMFSNYENILKMHTMITYIVFCVFSVILLSKFVIEDYSRPNVLLLFSYPVSRTKIFMAKLFLVSGFISLGFLLSSLVSSVLFFLTESLVPIISGNITFSVMGSQIINAITFVLLILSISFISLRVGFTKKSVSTTIVTGILLATTLGQLIMGIGSSICVNISAILLFLIGLGFAKSTSNKISKMEV